MGCGKKYALQNLSVSKDDLAEPLMGGPFAFPESFLSFVAISRARKP